MATKGLAEGFASKRPDHLPTEGRKWPPKGQQKVLLERDQITYQLRATKGSAEGFAAKRPDHLPTEGRRWPPKGQEQVLQQRDQITYPLRVGDDHQRVNSNFC